MDKFCGQKSPKISLILVKIDIYDEKMKNKQKPAFVMVQGKIQWYEKVFAHFLIFLLFWIFVTLKRFRSTDTF